MTCDSCKHAIEGTNYHFDDGKFYHEDCYRNLNAYKCDECKQQIDGNDNCCMFRGKHFHHGCFSCTQCHRPLSGEVCNVFTGRRFCRRCR
ncbi:four and a half LIM domains protein 5-like [Hydractinia symbiolongicarpus]|uniref:four and a half LIM domains protein 5-like n=1 Tax=Hydractinia symbiolongicarpus TaxID=13093 RepID=UPI00254C59AE|nr:four and a half LIM domains protein 5-like [Hydractinia symbiolongicarpus]